MQPVLTSHHSGVPGQLLANAFSVRRGHTTLGQVGYTQLPASKMSGAIRVPDMALLLAWYFLFVSLTPFTPVSHSHPAALAQVAVWLELPRKAEQ